MKHPEKDLWKSIKAFEIGDPRANFSFTDRLTRENDWTLEYALRVIWEYKKFMFLICVSDHSCTPSDQVDQVWHLHLLYTHSYWEDFCQKTIGRDIHHGPTKGGSAERSKYADLYERTKKRYFQVFDQHPPQDIWPGTKERFSLIKYQRVNLNSHWICKKPAIFNRLFHK